MLRQEGGRRVWEQRGQGGGENLLMGTRAAKASSRASGTDVQSEE